MAAFAAMVLVSVLAGLGAARAEEQTAKPKALERAVAEMDRVRATWSEGITKTVERFDRLFGDERLDDEADRTRVVVGIGVRADERDGARLQNRFRAHLALPNLEKRLLLFVEDAFESERADRLDALTDSLRESRPLTGLRWATETVGRARFIADVGARLGGRPQVVGRLRLSFTRPYEHWERRLMQSILWYSADGWTTRSELRWTRDLGPGWLFRSTTGLDWRERESGVSPSQSLALFLSRGPASGHRWEVRGAWPETPATERAGYVVEYGWRRRLHRDWLYLEMGPGVEFRQDEGYSANPFGVVRIEIAFGG